LLASIVVVGACGGGATGSEQALCEDARARSEIFTAEGFRTADPEVLGVLRELAHQAPTPVRDDFEEVVEASSDAELHQGLSEIEKFLAEECGIDVID
jgi:hypothetical protein